MNNNKKDNNISQNKKNDHNLLKKSSLLQPTLFQPLLNHKENLLNEQIFGHLKEQPRISTLKKTNALQRKSSEKVLNGAIKSNLKTHLKSKVDKLHLNKKKILTETKKMIQQSKKPEQKFKIREPKQNNIDVDTKAYNNMINGYSSSFVGFNAKSLAEKFAKGGLALGIGAMITYPYLDPKGAAQLQELARQERERTAKEKSQYDSSEEMMNYIVNGNKVQSGPLPVDENGYAILQDPKNINMEQVRNTIDYTQLVKAGILPPSVLNNKEQKYFSKELNMDTITKDFIEDTIIKEDNLNPTNIGLEKTFPSPEVNMNYLEKLNQEIEKSMENNLKMFSLGDEYNKSRNINKNNLKKLAGLGIATTAGIGLGGMHLKHKLDNINAYEVAHGKGSMKQMEDQEKVLIEAVKKQYAQDQKEYAEKHGKSLTDVDYTLSDAEAKKIIQKNDLNLGDIAPDGTLIESIPSFQNLVDNVKSIAGTVAGFTPVGIVANGVKGAIDNLSHFSNISPTLGKNNNNNLRGTNMKNLFKAQKNGLQLDFSSKNEEKNISNAITKFFSDKGFDDSKLNEEKELALFANKMEKFNNKMIRNFSNRPNTKNLVSSAMANFSKKDSDLAKKLALIGAGTAGAGVLTYASLQNPEKIKELAQEGLAKAQEGGEKLKELAQTGGENLLEVGKDINYGAQNLINKGKLAYISSTGDNDDFIKRTSEGDKMAKERMYDVYDATIANGGTPDQAYQNALKAEGNSFTNITDNIKGLITGKQFSNKLNALSKHYTIKNFDKEEEKKLSKKQKALLAGLGGTALLGTGLALSKPGQNLVNKGILTYEGHTNDNDAFIKRTDAGDDVASQRYNDIYDALVKNGIPENKARQMALNGASDSFQNMVDNGVGAIKEGFGAIKEGANNLWDKITDNFSEDLAKILPYANTPSVKRIIDTYYGRN